MCAHSLPACVKRNTVNEQQRLKSISAGSVIRKEQNQGRGAGTWRETERAGERGREREREQEWERKGIKLIAKGERVHLIIAATKFCWWN